MDTQLTLSAVVLAAGKGTRMKSKKAKVLHEVFYKPMVQHVLDTVAALRPERVVVIVGHQEEAVRQSLQGYNVIPVRQKRQLGTGHAVLLTEEVIPEENGLVLIVCGDTPLISKTSLECMLAEHRDSGADLSVMTTKLADPTGYGRIVAKDDQVQEIVEEGEADARQKKICEVNSGIYLVDRRLLFEGLSTITPDNSQGEFYLTDIVAYGVSKNKKIVRYCNENSMEVLGVNSKVELEAAHRRMQQKRNVQLLRSGVSMTDAASVSVSPFSVIGMDSLLKANVSVEGKSVVGENCVLENGVILRDCHLGDNVVVAPYKVLEGCCIESGAHVGRVDLDIAD